MEISGTGNEPGEPSIVSSLVEQISEKHLLPTKLRNDIDLNTNCPKCRKNYATLGSFRRHLQLFHRAAKDSDEYLQTFQASNRKKPEKIVADETEKKCILCQLIFPTDMQLSAHMTDFHKLIEVNDDDPPRHAVDPVSFSVVAKKKKTPNLNVSMCGQENDAMACPICQKVTF